MKPELLMRTMSRSELDELVAWAAEEGWNPGLHDADLFWATDPEAFIAAELNGEVIGGGAITCYNKEFGFMGFFIVKPECRGKGYGNTIWHARRNLLIDRLNPNATIGMDGVFTMQDYYAKGGFVFSHRHPRFSCIIDKPPVVDPDHSDNIQPLSSIPIDHIAAYDRQCFPAPRQTFLKAWISADDSQSFGYVKGGILRGFGVIRRCGDGCKVGPLFADDAAIAQALFDHMASFAIGDPIFLDAPENNPEASRITDKYQMKEVFGCARMYYGPSPNIHHHKIFGVTTFELG